MEHKKQHIITEAYLKEWCDPRTPKGYIPYVWRVSKNGKSIDNKAPKNILHETDFYTMFDESGNRDLKFEQYLHKIEDDFLMARKSIQSHLPITNIEFQSLVVFIASTFVRTKSHKQEQREIWNDLLSLYKSIGIDQYKPETIRKIEELKNQPLPYHIINFLNLSIPKLLRMKLTIMVASDNSSFITSDNPVLWLDPLIMREKRVYSFFGLDSPYLEILFPLSPYYLAKLTQNGLDEYLFVKSNSEIVNEINKMIVIFSDQYIIVNHDKPNEYWFSEDKLQ